MTNRIVHVRTTAGTGDQAGGIGDIAIWGSRLYSTNGTTGGVATWAAGGGILATTPFGGLGGAAPQLSMLDLAGGPALLSTGQAAGLTRLYRIGANGDLAAPRALDFGAAPVLAATALAAGAGAGAGDLIYTTTLGGRGIDTWRLVGNVLTKLGATTPVGGNAATYDLTDLTVAKVGAARFVVVTSSMDNALSVFRVGATGALTMTDRLVPAEGFFVANPELLTTLSYSGETFVLAGSAGSGSLTVTSLGADGQLRVRDQVNDQLGTRFAAPTALEAITLGAHAFVAIAGGDDGITLFRLLPDGRLLLLDAFEDTAGRGGTALGDVTGLALRGVGTALEIYAAGREETSISQFRVDFGALGQVIEGSARSETLTGTAGADLLMGGAGNDTLYGRAGADVLVDGAGSDRLFGGSGADIFSLRADGVTDVIADFEAGLDRLDLSEWGPVTDLGITRLYSTASGAEILWRGERLVLQSANGRPIPLAALTPFFDGFSHVVTTAIRGPQVLLGSLREDLLVGGIGADDIQGWRGADRLLGGDGDDILSGERGQDSDATANLVFRIYQATLGRAPDPGGLASWIDLLDSGTMPVRQAIGGFVGSREFRATYGETTPGTFVDLLYQNVLDRAGDAAGQRYWTAEITSGRIARVDVVQGFANSPEFVARTAHDAIEATFTCQVAGWSDEAFRLYGATLGRAPDVAGLTYWAEALALGTDLGAAIGGFTGSREFQARYGSTTDAGFVALLYRNVLGRAGDAAGQKYWTGQITSGAQTRAEVVEGFSESAEYQARSAPALKAWMRAGMADDRLEGGGGSNTLIGGLGADTFVFSALDRGSHTVVDLEPWDRLVFEDFGYTGFAEVRARMTFDGENVNFVHQGVRVTLEDTRLSDLTADDFLFG